MIKTSDNKYSKEDLEVVIARLEKTLEIIGNSNILGLDIDRYKLAICALESSG